MTMLTPDETILGLIAMHICHGYQLVEIFQNPDELGDVWRMSTSQIYAVLKRLEKQELIIGQAVESDNAPSRTEYQLTAEGRSQLENWLNNSTPSVSIRRVRVEFLSRLYIARQLNVPTIPIVRRQKNACQAERKRLIDERGQKAFGIAFLAHELVMAQLDAVLIWIDRCELVPTGLDDIEA